MNSPRQAWDWHQALAEMPEIWEDPLEDLIPFISRLHEQKVCKVHDFGCGAGRHVVYLAQQGFEVTASDMSPNGVEITQQKLAKLGLEAEVLCCTPTPQPFEDAQFDAILAVHCIYHSSRPELEQIIAEIHRTLRPGGWLFVTFNSIRNDSYGKGRPVAPDTFVKVGGVEDGIIHFFADEKAVYDLLGAFELRRIYHKEEIFLDQGSDHRHAHWLVWAQKRSLNAV